MSSNKNLLPDYKQIFEDILDKKYPEKRAICQTILNKSSLSVLDVITLNKKIFSINKNNETENQKHRSYTKSDILQMLDYQKKHKLNNSQLARHFKLSRNTVSKWKKTFLV